MHVGVPWQACERLGKDTERSAPVAFSRDGARVQVFQHGVQVSGPQPCLGHRAPDGGAYQWQTYNEIAVLATNVGAGLRHFGICMLFSSQAIEEEDEEKRREDEMKMR